MYKNIVYNFILIFIIIKYVESQDNDPDQPADDEEEDNNFDVLDIEQIIQERLSRFDDPQYQPDYQQLEESQYQPQPETQPQPLTQPQYYDLYQTQPEPQYQPEQFGQYEPQQYGPEYQLYQTQTHHIEQQSDTYGYYEQSGVSQPQQYYVPSAPQTQIQIQIQPQSYDQYQPYAPVTQPHTTQEPLYQYYLPESQDQYGYQLQYETQTLYDTGQQPITETQPQEQYYYPYQPTQPTPQVPQQQYYEPPQPQPTQPPQYGPYQHYMPPQTVTKAKQPTEQLEPEVIQVQQIDDEEREKKRQQRAKLLDKLKRKIQRPDKTKPSKQQTAQPRKRKRPRTTSGDQGEEEEEQKPKRGRLPKSYRKSRHIKLFKFDSEGNLVQMTERDYDIRHSDKTRSIYEFKTNLEQIEFDNEVIYVHTSGTPYCFSLSHSKKTDIIIITNIQEFVLIKKNKGIWTRTDHVTPYYVKFYKRDSGGNEVLITSDQYSIHFTSIGSFRYKFHPGIKCTKIIVKDMVAWKKSNKDDGFPELIYVSPKLSVILRFKKYTKTLGKKHKKYKILHTKKNLKEPKYI
ncbi:SVSP family protein [Theileria parva strain Muguga]|uniref:Theileria-specific sub-telomeric protein, SVSP family n=1 Tax=Theileria parva TaxID=5875 RepID=Q4MYF9_THEPA|nr:SVSP family protein [Theileria parva strain Muguga]EAN30723.1 SVSP family protein [Theileria parva strain Muguga]|eukprot:XP_763006.1 hypothetical protein [Theileria parva strain Muguga]